MQTTEKSRQSWYGDFYLEVHLVATKLILVETSSKVAGDPLASGDSQVTLSHVECSHRALEHDSAGPLVALRVSLLAVDIDDFRRQRSAWFHES